MKIIRKILFSIACIIAGTVLALFFMGIFSIPVGYISCTIFALLAGILLPGLTKKKKPIDEQPPH